MTEREGIFVCFLCWSRSLLTFEGVAADHYQLKAEFKIIKRQKIDDN